MNIKKVARDRIWDNLNKQLSDLQYKKYQNKYSLKKLVEEQKVIKKQINEIIDLKNILITKTEIEKAKEKKGKK